METINKKGHTNYLTKYVQNINFNAFVRLYRANDINKLLAALVDDISRSVVFMRITLR